MSSGAIAYRAPRVDELAECALIWHTAVNEYMTRLGHPLPPPVLEPAIRLAEHLLATDPDLFRVAVKSEGFGRPDRIVGFGIGLQREHVWFLSQLYVLPAEQHRGLGRALLSQVLPSSSTAGEADRERESGLAARPGVLATCTDSAQPVSNGLYSKLGIVARLPVFNLVGRPRPGAAFPPLPDDVEVVPIDTPAALAHRNPAEPGRLEILDVIDSVDREILGYAHRSDHLFLRVQGRSGFLYRSRTGQVLGYGYSSAVGRFGPVAILDETLIAPVIGHLVRTIEPRGALSTWIPGANDRAMVALLRAGLRIEGFPAMLCWTRTFASFDRYMPAGLALL